MASDGIAPCVFTTTDSTKLAAKNRKKFTITVCYVHGDAHKRIEPCTLGVGKVESAPIGVDGLE